MPINIKRKVPTKQRCVTYHQDVGDEAILCWWSSMWENRIYASVNVKEYDILSNSCNKIVFCTVCCPKVPLYSIEIRRQKLFSDSRMWEDTQNNFWFIRWNRKSLFIRKNCKRTSKKLQQHTLSSMQPYNVVSDSSCSMAVDIVRELEDKEHHKNNLIFYNVPEPTTPSWKADSAYISDLCRIIFDLNIEINKLFCTGKKIDKKHRPLLICSN